MFQNMTDIFCYGISIELQFPINLFSSLGIPCLLTVIQEYHMRFPFEMIVG